MENNEPKKYFDISKRFDGIGEEQMIWEVVQNVLKRHGIEPKSGIKGLSVRYYDDGNYLLTREGALEKSAEEELLMEDSND